MLFQVTKPTHKMCAGALFYTVPLKSEIDKAFDELADLCSELASVTIMNGLDNQVQNKIDARMQKELVMVKVTGAALDFLIMYEISRLSKEMGYPISMSGFESGLIISYVLGLSNVNPSQLNYSSLQTDLVYDDALISNRFTPGLRIAEPIREHIQSRMDKMFCEIECERDYYKSIELSPCDDFEKIGKFAKRSGEDYSKINLEDRELIEMVNLELCKERFKCEPYYCTPESSLDLARVFAYAVCSTDSKDNYLAVRDYVFRDDIYAELKTRIGYNILEIPKIIKNWATYDKEEILESFEMCELNEKMINTYRELYNQWPAAACLSRVNARLMVKYYQLKLQK